MELIEMGAKLLTDKHGLDIDSAQVATALNSLLADGGGNFDLAGLASRMASSGELGSVVSSWLGDGANAAISPDSLLGLLGEDKVSQFAGQIGTDTGSAATGLAEVLPQMMDKASTGGNLLDSLGGAGGLLGAAKNFLS